MNNNKNNRGGPAALRKAVLESLLLDSLSLDYGADYGLSYGTSRAV